MSQFSLDDLVFKPDESDPSQTPSPFFNCVNEDVLQARYASEYVQLGPHVNGEIWLLKDQFERYPWGPDQHESWDPLYGEPTTHIRPRAEDTVEEKWEFESPIPFKGLLTEESSDYVEDEKGSGKNRTLTVVVSLYDMHQAGLGCPGATGEVGYLTDEAMTFPDRPRHGDVIYIGDDWDEFFDIESSGRRGYTKGKKFQVWLEIQLVRRSKYLPRRKDILQGKEDLPYGNLAGTEFSEPEPEPKDTSP